MSQSTSKLTATASIICAVTAALMPFVSRILYDPSTPGDDRAFTSISLTPALLLAGLVLGWIARRASSSQLARIGFWLNLGLLAALILFVGFQLASYQGR